MKNGVATSIVDGLTLFKMLQHMPTPLEKPHNNLNHVNPLRIDAAAPFFNCGDYLRRV